jgi:hypothetical protein
MGWRERRDFPIDRATGNVAVETEEASDVIPTRERTDLVGLGRRRTWAQTLASWILLFLGL